MDGGGVGIHVEGGVAGRYSGESQGGAGRAHVPRQRRCGGVLFLHAVVTGARTRAREVMLRESRSNWRVVLGCW